MRWNPWMTELTDVLADLYPTVKDSQRIVLKAGLHAGLVSFDDRAVVNWVNILQEAAKQSHAHSGQGSEKIRAILAAALEDYPDHDLLRALDAEEPAPVKGPDIREKIGWTPEEDAEHFEKLIGEQSTLLPIRFLELGMKRARSVARIVRGDRMSGTGFLIGKGMMLTNHHVLPTQEIAGAAVAEFNYQETVEGLPAQITKVALDPLSFSTRAENDWTVVGVAAGAEAEWGTIPLEAAPTSVGAFVNIIQHPGGGPKQIALYHNTVVYAGNGRVQYLTDTLPGSSGSPVFDDQWRVVALHHSGGMLREPGARKKAYYRNEGIAMTAILDDFRTAGIQVG